MDILPSFIENILVIFAFVGMGLLALYLLSRPFKWLYKWILNGICGIIILFLLSVFGGNFGLIVPLNPITVAVSALLGIPGVGLIILKQFFI
ncbi:MAG: pro-sigmaK processing inhibitor BofA family protein [Clostridiales bacterium]